jgi:hypothetical protein
MQTPPRHVSPDGHCAVPEQSWKPPPGQPPVPDGAVHVDVSVAPEKQQTSGVGQFSVPPHENPNPRQVPAATQWSGAPVQHSGVAPFGSHVVVPQVTAASTTTDASEALPEDEPEPDDEDEPAPDDEDEPAPDDEDEPAPDDDDEPAPDDEDEPAPDDEDEPAPDDEDETAPDDEDGASVAESSERDESSKGDESSTKASPESSVESSPVASAASSPGDESSPPPDDELPETTVPDEEPPEDDDPLPPLLLELLVPLEVVASLLPQATSHPASARADEVPSANKNREVNRPVMTSSKVHRRQRQYDCAPACQTESPIRAEIDAKVRLPVTFSGGAGRAASGPRPRGRT